MLYPHVITICKQVLVTLSSHFHCETPCLPFKTLAKSSGHSFNPAGEGQRTQESAASLVYRVTPRPARAHSETCLKNNTNKTHALKLRHSKKVAGNGLHSEETGSVSVSVLIPSNGRIPSHNAGWLHETPSICTNCILSHTLFVFA